jgi:hypothetical protein
LNLYWCDIRQVTRAGWLNLAGAQEVCVHRRRGAPSLRRTITTIGLAVIFAEDQDARFRLCDEDEEDEEEEDEDDEEDD